MRASPFLCFLIAPLVLGTGCATMLRHGTKTDFLVTSDPPGAAVLLDERKLGVTPVTVQLAYGEARPLAVQKAHYEPAECVLKRRVNSAYLGMDLLWAWVFGIAPAVDFGTKAWEDFFPAVCQLKLVRTPGTESIPDPAPTPVPEPAPSPVEVPSEPPAPVTPTCRAEEQPEWPAASAREKRALLRRCSVPKPPPSPKQGISEPAPPTE